MRGLLHGLALLELAPPVLARALEPFPVPVRTLDALHLASLEFLPAQRVTISLSNDDARRRGGVAESLQIEHPIFDLHIRCIKVWPKEACVSARALEGWSAPHKSAPATSMAACKAWSHICRIGEAAPAPASARLSLEGRCECREIFRPGYVIDTHYARRRVALGRPHSAPAAMVDGR